jgi:hypothetical protein
MTRIMGPMHSDDARGLYGGTKTGVVFSAWRGARYTKSYAVPRNPRTVRQLGMRALLRCLNALWATLSDAEKSYWTAYGSAYNLPGFQAFCKYNMRQAGEGWMPQLEANEEHLSAPTAPTALAANVVDNVIVVTWTDAALAYTTGIHVGTAGGFTPAMRNLTYATPATDGEDRQCTLRVAPGTYYLKARNADEDGGVGAPTASVGPVVIT